MVPDIPQLLVNDVKVVEEPLGGRRDSPMFPNRFGDGEVRRP